MIRGAVISTTALLLGACVDNSGLFSHDAGTERPAEASLRVATAPVGITVRTPREPWWAPLERQCRAKGGEFVITDSNLPVCHRDGGVD